MKILAAFLVLAALVRTAEWWPEDIHPRVFQIAACYLSDTAQPVVTEINLNAVRALIPARRERYLAHRNAGILRAYGR